MRITLFALLTAVSVLSSGCGMFGGSSRRPAATAPQPQTLFVNRVWRVVESTAVPVGTLYVFLSDNTWLITPPEAAAPTLGRWHYAAGGLVLIEAGYRVPADILESSEERLVIRILRPAGAVEVAMQAAR